MNESTHQLLDTKYLELVQNRPIQWQFAWKIATKGGVNEEKSNMSVTYTVTAIRVRRGGMVMVY
jgi:hypothetical protein